MHLYYAIAFGMGVLLPLQAAINNDLRGLLGGSVVLATMISFAVGTLTMALLALAGGARVEGGTATLLGSLQWWQLSGGVLGATIVGGSILLAPRIGLAGMTTLVVAGQLCASLVLDRLGFLGLAERAFTVPRVAGAVIVVAGVLLMNYGDRLRS